MSKRTMKFEWLRVALIRLLTSSLASIDAGHLSAPVQTPFPFLISPGRWLLGSVSLAFLVGVGTTLPMGVATLAWMLLSGGVTLHLPRSLHAVWQTSGVFLDLLLVGVLQWQRSAIQTATSFELSGPQLVHVTASLGAVLLYGPVIFLGARKLKARSVGPTSEMDGKRRLHRNAGLVAYALRTLGFFLMFSMLSRS